MADLTPLFWQFWTVSGVKVREQVWLSGGNRRKSALWLSTDLWTCPALQQELLLGSTETRGTGARAPSLLWGTLCSTLMLNSVGDREKGLLAV